jgi:cytochrome c oxidase cbb3-type subunit 1
LVWVPLMPAYYSAFVWRENTRRWRAAVLVWWALLIPTGWCLFLPGVLDRFKFTDGLVGHSLLAMAGFLTSLLVLLLLGLLGSDGDAFDTRWSFVAWHAGTALYIAIMFIAGWIEGGDPAFTMMPNTTRTILYGIRLASGLAMMAASWEWLWQLTRRMRARSQTSAVSPVTCLIADSANQRAASR